MVMIAAFGCSDEDSRPAPPPPPPQLSLAPVTGLPDNDVFDILVDSQGRQWFSTESGVLMVEGSTRRVFDAFDGIPNRRCRAIGELNDKIFVGTWGQGAAFADSAAIYDDSTLWTALPFGSNRIVSGRVAAIAVDPINDFVFFGTAGGLTQYKDDLTIPEPQRYNNSFNVRSLNLLGKSNNIAAIIFDRHSLRGRELWLAKRITQDEQGNLPGGVTNIILATSTSAARAVHYTAQNSAIPEEDAVAILRDPALDLLWSGFASTGVASIDVAGSKWERLTTLEGLVSDFVNSIDFMADGTMLVATQAGLSRIEPSGRITNYVQGSGFPDARIRKVYVDSDDNVWLGFVQAGAAMVTQFGE